MAEVEQERMKEALSKLGFLYKKIGIPSTKMWYWFQVPEFVDAMLDAVNTSKTIDRDFVLNLMHDIYEHKLETATKKGEFSFPSARKAIRYLESQSNDGLPDSQKSG